MNPLQSTVSIAIVSGISLGTLELAEVVGGMATQYNDAVQTQAQCYKERDFKCIQAREKFEKVLTEVKGANQ